jgi:NitT/TauT family transport system permease protein
MEQGTIRPYQLALRKIQSLLFFVFLALLMEIASRLQLVSPLYFPPFSRILVRFGELAVTGVLLKQLMFSLLRMGCGYFLAAAVMIPLGIVIGTHKRCFLALDPTLELLRPLPPPAIIPIAILFMGIGDGMKIFVVFFACSFPILTNSIDGSRLVHPLFVQTGRTLGLSRIERLWKITLPAASPQIVSGLRTSLPICLIVTILAEMIGGEDGIGFWTLKMQRTFSIPEMYSGVLVTGILGYFLNRILWFLEVRVLGWHQGWKKTGQ